MVYHRNLSHTRPLDYVRRAAGARKSHAAVPGARTSSPHGNCRDRSQRDSRRVATSFSSRIGRNESAAEGDKKGTLLPEAMIEATSGRVLSNASLVGSSFLWFGLA